MAFLLLFQYRGAAEFTFLRWDTGLVKSGNFRIQTSSKWRYFWRFSRISIVEFETNWWWWVFQNWAKIIIQKWTSNIYLVRIYAEPCGIFAVLKKTNSCGDSWNGSLGWSWMRTKSQAFKSGIVYSQCEVDKIAKANNKSLPGSTTHGFCGLSKLGASWSFIMLYRIGFTTNEWLCRQIPDEHDHEVFQIIQGGIPFDVEVC